MSEDQVPASAARRRLLAALGAATGAAAAGSVLPSSWTRPIINSIDVPVHAQSTPVGDSGSFSATNTPLFLPDSSSATASITVFGLAGTITSVTLDFALTHTWNGDLQAYLSGPGLSDSVLFTNVCGSSDNMNVTLDDTAGSAIGSSCPPSGTFRTGSGTGLSAFNGTSPNGVWSLRFTDTAAADTGTLTSATLNIETTG
jgi:subtilisin-like proprotein convertase family protein